MSMTPEKALTDTIYELIAVGEGFVLKTVSYVGGTFIDGHLTQERPYILVEDNEGNKFRVTVEQYIPRTK